MKVSGLYLALATMAIVVAIGAPAHAASPNTPDAQALLSANSYSRLSSPLDSGLHIASKPVSNTLRRIRRQKAVPFLALYSAVLCAYGVRNISILSAASNVHSLLRMTQLARLWRRGPPSFFLA